MNPLLKKFFSYYKGYRLVLAADLLCAFTVSGVVLVYPLLVRMITARAASPESFDTSFIVRIGAVFLFLMVIEYLGNFFMTYWGHLMGARMEFNMRNDLFSHLQKLSFSYYDNARTGQLMSRLTNDLFDVTELAHHGPEDLIVSTIKIIGSFIILAGVNLRLTLLIFTVLPLMFLFSLHYNRKMKAAFKRNRERIADINSQVEDNLSGVRVVRSFANEALELDKFRQGNNRFVESKRSSYYYLALFHSGLSGFSSFISILAVIGGTLFIRGGFLDIADLLTFMLYINTLVEPIRRLLNFTEQFQNGVTGFERFAEMLDIEPDIADAPDAIEIKNVKGMIEFTGVGFRYSADSPYIFRGFNLRVNPGEYVALVGSSGVGKTTLCSLIPRFYDASEGKVSIDGMDVRALTMKSIRDSIGIVQQDVYLFSGSIRDNILYGRPSATEEEIIAAAKHANAHDFIMELPDGYDTYIGQRGVKLSGGQKQRLSIARVFLKNPAILIFDEATSSLDNESEQVVQESFERLAENRTTIVIAHRLSTVRNAGRIVVLTEDGVAEEGSHSELLNDNGIYAKFYNLQYR